jgi:hypothetical protein
MKPYVGSSGRDVSANGTVHTPLNIALAPGGLHAYVLEPLEE